MFLVDGNPQDAIKAQNWVKKQKVLAAQAARRANIRSRVDIKISGGKIHHGYTEDVSKNLAMCSTRRDINSRQKSGEIVALAAFSPVAIRMYAARIGVSTAEMYRNPELLKRMIKDPDYSKFRVNENAAKMI